MKYSEKISNKLNDLLTRTYDAEKGYKLAQEKIDNPSIKKFLGDKIQQRYNFGHELKDEITKFGELPEKGGSLKGDIHRTWMNLTSSISSDDTERILEEVERGEKASLDEYNEILSDEDMILAPSTESLLVKQRDAIKKALNAAKRYEEAVS
ncbi:ferritin-like domain-containing protein [Maribacter aestuarii]|uniref:ferritin-like domain-containing protein n=1 Tax=Maribacter aestuarii TaxID=1130723 RepID=UPI00248C507B|nr:PA2169 family four-helix-bundle protein [Maribacter aestuarii]